MTDQDRLFLPDRVLKKFAKEHSTPFYLYDEKMIRNSVAALQQAFSWNPGFDLFFPVRMNPNPAILRIFLQNGCKLSCCSLAELNLCAKAGFEGSRILYAPMILDREADRLCRKLNAIRLVNREDLLPEQCIPRIMLRLEADRPSNQSDHSEIRRFGMPEHKLLDILSVLQHYGTESISISMEGAAMEKRPDYYVSTAERLFSLANRIRQSYGICVDCIHLGSGLPFSYRHGYPAPDVCSIAAAIRTLCDEILEPAGLSDTRISMEPGRYLAAGCGIFISAVCAVYKDDMKTIVIDGCMSQLERPSQFGNYHHVSVLGKQNVRDKTVSNVIGCIPDMRDTFAKKRVLPQVKEGDYVVIHDVGADGAALQNGYGGMPACAQYLHMADGTFSELPPAHMQNELL